MFDESLHRRVPMQMEGTEGEGLNTVGMWAKEEATFKAGESVRVERVAIAPEIYRAVVKTGVKFELWDGKLFASGTVLERIEAGWSSEVYWRVAVARFANAQPPLFASHLVRRLERKP